MPIAYRVVGNTIYASDYNRLQEKISSILGAGGGSYGFDYGYGQPLASSQVIGSTASNNNTGDLVTVKQMNDLRLDIMKCWHHQTMEPFPLSTVATDDVVRSGPLTDAVLGQVNQSYNDFTFCVNQVDANRLFVNPAAMSLIANKVEMSFTNWNNYKTHEITVTFSDSNHRRYFFNAGGEIRITASHPGSYTINTKSWVWQTLLANAGMVRFNYDNNRAAVSSAPAILFYKSASGSSVVYAENYYKVLVASPADNVLLFRIIFHDVDVGDQVGGSQPGPPVDENVTGTTKSTMSLYYPSGIVVDPEDNQAYNSVVLNQPLITSLQGSVY